MVEFHEAVIVGAGPAGLTAGIYLMRAGIDAVLLEKMVSGGTPMKYDFVENYPGFPAGVPSKELMTRMTDQAKRFGLKIVEFSDINEITSENGRFQIKAGSNVFESLGVIIATGTDPVKMGIPGEERLVGMGVSFCAICDGMFFRGLDVAVIGGGDAAIQEGLTLANLARKVYVVHRRDTLRAQKIIQERAFRQENIAFLWNKKPVEVVGTNQVQGLILEDTVTKEISELKVEGVFVYIGARSATTFLGNLVERDASGFIITDGNLSTKTSGLYAAGDVRSKMLRQISTAVGDGALAAVNLERFIVEQG